MSRFKNSQKKFRIEKIKSEHAAHGPHSMVLILDGLKASFNVGKIFRSAQAFGVREVCLVNLPFFDPYPAKGAFKQTRSRSFPDFASCYQALKDEGYVFYALLPSGDEVLGECEIPPKVAFVVGHEEFGLSFDPNYYPDLHTLRIRQWGLVESLNVSVAASLALFEYCRRWGRRELSQKIAGASKHLDPVIEQV